MKYIKSYKKFEDATSTASSSAGMGAVVSAQPGSLPGTTGTTGSGDIGFTFKKEKRKKGKPSQVTDLRDLAPVKTNKVNEKFYNPPQEIKDRLDSIVKDLLSKYEGGRPFFDALDDSIKDITNQDMMMALLKGNTNEWVATSGEFGDKIYKLWKEGKFKCKGLVVFNGKMLTNKTGVNGWYPTDFELDGKDFVYIDDSYFSGSTAKKINDFLKEHNSKIKLVSVIYDGSKEKVRGVKSFFRYYK